MTTIASLRKSAHQVVCDKCGEPQIAPQWAEYFEEEGLILNLWFCGRCGNHFETEFFGRPDAELEGSHKAIEEFWPSLLVA